MIHGQLQLRSNSSAAWLRLRHSLSEVKTRTAHQQLTTHLPGSSHQPQIPRLHSLSSSTTSSSLFTPSVSRRTSCSNGPAPSSCFSPHSCERACCKDIRAVGVGGMMISSGEGRGEVMLLLKEEKEGRGRERDRRSGLRSAERKGVCASSRRRTSD